MKYTYPRFSKILRKHYGSFGNHFQQNVELLSQEERKGPESSRWAQILGISICTPILLNTPPYVFLYRFLFRNITELYVLCNDTLFSLRNVVGLYELCNNALFDFQNVVELYGLCNNACFDFQNVVRLYGLHNDGC